MQPAGRPMVHPVGTVGSNIFQRQRSRGSEGGMFFGGRYLFGACSVVLSGRAQATKEPTQ